MLADAQHALPLVTCRRWCRRGWPTSPFRGGSPSPLSPRNHHARTWLRFTAAQRWGLCNHQHVATWQYATIPHDPLSQILPLRIASASRQRPNAGPASNRGDEGCHFAKSRTAFAITGAGRGGICGILSWAAGHAVPAGAACQLVRAGRRGTGAACIFGKREQPCKYSRRALVSAGTCTAKCKEAAQRLRHVSGVCKVVISD
jgi:hypothetical protein